MKRIEKELYLQTERDGLTPASKGCTSKSVVVI